MGIETLTTRRITTSVQVDQEVTMTLQPYKPKLKTVPPPTGARTLVLSVASYDDVVKAVSQGLPYETLTHLLRGLDLPLTTFTDLVGLSTTTLSRRRDKTLTPEESDLVYRYARVFERATEMLGTEDGARRWLKTPNLALGGVSPLEYSRTETGANYVDGLITALEDGVIV